MLFSGDTLHLLAGFRTRPTGEVRVTISGAAGGEMQLCCVLAEPLNLELLPRIAAARRLAALDEEEAGALAEQYQLVSQHTSFVVVQVRAEGEKAETLPELQTVAQMLAAGWGATGSVDSPMLERGFGVQSPLEACYEQPCMDIVQVRMSASRTRFRSDSDPSSDDIFGLPAFSLKADDPIPPCSPADFLAALASDVGSGTPLPTTLAELEARGLPTELLEQLAALIDSEDHEESDVVRVVIALLARSAAGAGLATTERAALEGTVMTDRNLRSARAAVQPLVANVTVATC
jgi:hypothetical protein